MHVVASEFLRCVVLQLLTPGGLDARGLELLDGDCEAGGNGWHGAAGALEGPDRLRLAAKLRGLPEMMVTNPSKWWVLGLGCRKQCISPLICPPFSSMAPPALTDARPHVCGCNS